MHPSEISIFIQNRGRLLTEADNNGVLLVQQESLE